MKNQIMLLMWLLLLFNSACNDESETEQFNSVTSLNLSYRSNGSILTDFQVNSIFGVEEFWVFAAKASSKENITLDMALGLSSNQVQKIVPAGLNYNVIIESTQLDTDGDPLASGNDYVVFVLATGNPILSNPSSSVSFPLKSFSDVSDFTISEVKTPNDISKIKVKFTANTVDGVDEFWVIFAKYSVANTLTLENVMSLSEERYTVVAATERKNEIEIAGIQLDTDGDPMINQTYYVAFVFATGANKLSKPSQSKSFTTLEYFTKLNGIWIHDLANNQNPSDLKVVFDVNASIGVNEFRVFIANESPSTPISLSHLESLGANTYTTITSTQENSYTSFLNENQTDTDGNELSHGTSYNFYVYSSNLGTYSGSTEPFLFIDNQPIEGYYVGEFNDNLFTKIPYSAVFRGGNEANPNLYAGPAYISNNFTPGWGGVDDGNIVMELSDTEIISFTYYQDLPNYRGGCPGKYTGTGSINADFNIVINFIGDDCDGHHQDGVITLNRAWKTN